MLELFDSTKAFSSQLINPSLLCRQNCNFVKCAVNPLKAIKIEQGIAQIARRKARGKKLKRIEFHSYIGVREIPTMWMVVLNKSKHLGIVGKERDGRMQF